MSRPSSDRPQHRRPLVPRCALVARPRSLVHLFLAVLAVLLGGLAGRSGAAVAQGLERALPGRGLTLLRPSHADRPAPEPATVCPDGPALTGAEARSLAEAAAAAVADPAMTVVVVDRLGRPLALFRKPGAGGSDDDRALGLARAAAFFSNDQAPLSSRTVRFLAGLHFPPGIARTPNAPLYGAELTNRGCDMRVPFAPGRSVPPPRGIAGGPCDAFGDSGCGPGIVTGKVDDFDSDPAAVDPGGVPLFRGAALVGGIGVAGVPPAHAEYAAFAAASGGFLPAPAPPGVIFLDGVRLPFVEQRSRPADASPGGPGGSHLLPPTDGACVPDGELVVPRAGTLLSEAAVRQIASQAVAGAGRTRANLRLPPGSRARMVVAVADLDGEILALVRMPDATVFSIDVAVAKARNVVYWSDPASPGPGELGLPPGTAVTNRTVSFGAQPLFPAGIDGTAPGPFFDLFRYSAAHPCRLGPGASGANQSGVVFFPGSVPLYRGRTLVGGLGVSGDGVEQDDYVSFLGAQGFLPPEDLWADNLVVRGVRLPFLQLPRNPER